MNKISIKVPATTANLACGFDVLGMCFNLYNKITFEKLQEQKLIFSKNVEKQYQNEDNLAYISFKYFLKQLNIPFNFGLKIDIKNNVPICRGLGSSSTLILAGVMAGNYLTNSNLSKQELLNIATQIEGHPDNLAPCIYGGLTASVMKNDKVITIHHRPHKSLRFLAFVPDFELSTALSRSVLPKQVELKDAIFNISCVPVLLKGIAEGDEELISQSLDDKLHQPYRRKLIPEYNDVEKILNKNGCKSVCLSGAGPTILAITKDENLVKRINEDIAKLKHNWKILDLKIDFKGARSLK